MEEVGYDRLKEVAAHEQTKAGVKGLLDPGITIINQWFYDVTSLDLSDQMQLITNDKFKSVEQWVLVSKRGPKVSAACFFYPSTRKRNQPYSPLKELLAPDEEPFYKEVSAGEYLAFYKLRGLDGNSTPSFHGKTTNLRFLFHDSEHS